MPKKDEPESKSTSQQKNRMAKNEFHAKWTRIHNIAKQSEHEQKLKR